jgi:hypothetical protein
MGTSHFNFNLRNGFSYAKPRFALNRGYPGLMQETVLLVALWIHNYKIN